MQSKSRGADAVSQEKAIKVLNAAHGRQKGVIFISVYDFSHLTADVFEKEWRLVHCWGRHRVGIPFEQPEKNNWRRRQQLT